MKYALDAVNKGLETSLSEGLSLEGILLWPLCGHRRQEREGTVAFLQNVYPEIPRASEFANRFAASSGSIDASE